MKSFYVDINSEKSAAIALKSCISILDSWDIVPTQQIMLLGITGDKFHSKKESSVCSLTYDTLFRISHILKIYKALGTLLPVKKQADSWLRKPNREFDGKSALDFILQDTSTNLAHVSAYLDAQLY